MPLDPISYSLAKKAKKVAESHSSRHEAGGEDQITGWIRPNMIGPYSNTATRLYFRTLDIEGTSPVNHMFSPTNNGYGLLGDSSLRWGKIYAVDGDFSGSVLIDGSLNATQTVTANTLKTSDDLIFTPIGASPTVDGQMRYNSNTNRLEFFQGTTVKQIAWLSDTSLLGLLKDKGTFWFNNNWAPSGMLSSAKSGTGSILWTTGYLQLSTGSTSGSYSRVYKMVGTGGLTISWDKNRHCLFSVRFSTLDCYIWLVTGYGYSPSSSTNNYNHIGFKVVNGILYGTVANGSNESTLQLEDLTGVTYTNKLLEFDYTAGSDVKFYVDGVYKDQITLNLPSGTSYATYFFWASVYNTAAANKYVSIYDVRVYQEG